MRHDAIRKVYSNAKMIDDSAGVFDFDGNRIQIDENLIQAKIAELRAAEQMRLLREERNRKLQETDWRFRSDLTPSQEWIDYCQALRDLPATFSPVLDILMENGDRILKEQTDWPTKPA